MKGQPGRADVWFDDDDAAVAVADRQMAVLRLSRDGDDWRPAVLARLPAPASDVVETATIARDGRGRWWIAATVQGRLYAWHSRDARAWSPPLPRGLHVDDICVVARIDGGVAAVWSDQNRDGTVARVRRDDAPPEEWAPAETVAQGGGNADDHLNAALQADGTPWIASKNSVDANGARRSTTSPARNPRSPEGTPWIVATDGAGRVYEADLRAAAGDAPRSWMCRVGAADQGFTTSPVFDDSVAASASASAATPSA